MREAVWEDDAEVDFEEESRAKFAAWRAVAVHADMEEESLRLERVFVSLEIARRKNDDEWKWQNVINWGITNCPDCPQMLLLLHGRPCSSSLE